MTNVDEWLAEAVSRNMRILQRYFAHACPCRFPRFVYWVTKPHGRGTDPLQNMLVVTCRHFGQADVAAAVRHDDSGGMWACPNCKTTWLDVCHEKSNLNYQHRFQLSTPSKLPPFVNQTVPTTEPEFSYEHRAEQWEAFMLEGVP